jgi:hypothetical protein
MLVLILAAGYGNGNTQPDAIATRFKQLETNGDVELSADEVKAALESLQLRLEGADKDGDGFLTLAEVQAHFRQPAAKPKDPARHRN